MTPISGNGRGERLQRIVRLLLYAAVIGAAWSIAATIIPVARVAHPEREQPETLTEPPVLPASAEGGSWVIAGVPWEFSASVDLTDDPASHLGLEREIELREGQRLTAEQSKTLLQLRNVAGRETRLSTAGKRDIRVLELGAGDARVWLMYEPISAEQVALLGGMASWRDRERNNWRSYRMSAVRAKAASQPGSLFPSGVGQRTLAMRFSGSGEVILEVALVDEIAPLRARLDSPKTGQALSTLKPLGLAAVDGHQVEYYTLGETGGSMFVIARRGE